MLKNEKTYNKQHKNDRYFLEASNLYLQGQRWIQNNLRRIFDFDIGTDIVNFLFLQDKHPC